MCVCEGGCGVVCVGASVHSLHSTPHTDVKNAVELHSHEIAQHKISLIMRLHLLPMYSMYIHIMYIHRYC